MKVLLLLAGVVALNQCNHEKKTTSLRGRLEVKGPCMNYTIAVLGDNVDTSLVEASWTNPSTGKTYQNVAKLGSPCDFPANIKEGDEFNFEINDHPDRSCAVCMIYYPVPSKKISIWVLPK